MESRSSFYGSVIPRDLPLVTVGVPVFNGEQYLPITLNCLLEQDYPNLEIVISDNASTDKTGDIAQEYAGLYPHLSYCRHSENKGSAVNFTSLIERAQGKYFMWAATHDKWSPGLISKAVQAMEANPEVVLSYAVPYWIRPDGETGPIETTLLDLRSSNKITRFVLTMWGLTACPHIYGVHRLSVLKELMPWRKMFGPDTHMLAKLACLGPFALLAEEKFYMRQCGDFNDWDSYFRKLEIPLVEDSAKSLYEDFICQHLKLVDEEFSNVFEKWALYVVTQLCMRRKYDWVPSVIQQARERRLEKNSCRVVRAEI